MLAPTNIYGPGNELCEAGQEVPEEWFTVLPDLKAHLDAIIATSGPATADPVVPDPTEVAAAVQTKVEAKLKTTRNRGTS